MARYVVMEPPIGAPTGEARIIRDGFALLGFLFPPLWLLWHRLWFAALLAFAVMLGLSVFGGATGSQVLMSLLSLLVSLFVALEGREMAISALRRRGWTEAAAFEADDLADAEIRYAYLRGDAPVPSGAPQAVVDKPAHGRAPAGPVLGLFAYPGR